MKVQFFRRSWQAAALLAVLTLLSGVPGSGQEAPAADSEAAVTDDAGPVAPIADSAAKKFRGRLPAYFATVVSAEQRQKVYEIQANYFERIAALEKQILELRAKQDQDVDGVLSAEQLAGIKKLRAAASAKRRGQPATQETAGSGQN